VGLRDDLGRRPVGGVLVHHRGLLWPTISACFSAFFAGWTTSALLGRFAKWGANAWV
jgi:hypothetical protein